MRTPTGPALHGSSPACLWESEIGQDVFVDPDELAFPRSIKRQELSVSGRRDSSSSLSKSTRPASNNAIRPETVRRCRRREIATEDGLGALNKQKVSGRCVAENRDPSIGRYQRKL